MLNSYLQKSIKNRLRRWDFCTPVSLFDGQRSKCADLTKHYFKVHTLGHNIYHIEENAGAYTTLLVGEQQALLIDTGYGFLDLSEVVGRLTRLPLTVVNTHGHLDHCGGDYLFKSVYINYTDLPVYLWYQSVEKPKFLEKFKKDYGSDIFKIWPESFDEERYMSAKARKLLPLTDGQVFELGGRRVTAYFLPGHTKGSTVFFDDASGLLFAGDDISKTVWIFFDHSAPLGEYVKGLDRLRSLPVRGIVSSHLPDVFGRQLIDWIMLAAAHAVPENSKLFVHPRTGQEAWFFRQKVTDMENVHSVRLVYPKK
ncbi:MAG: MBL fold metallo-hydrolase [Clostridiales bacterium]|nr:MBL fold metallo-hydrolase [Clostridiales bacterium]